MTAKKEETKVAILYDGKETSIDVNKPLPTEMLQKTNWQDYVEVRIIRAIARQMGVLKEVRFSKEETIARGEAKSGKSFVGLRQTCTITTVDGEVFEGIGAIAVTENTLITEALYGTVSRLRARAFKDAMKYVAEVFEFPETDVAPIKEPKELDVAAIIMSGMNKKTDAKDDVLPWLVDQLKTENFIPEFRKLIEEHKATGKELEKHDLVAIAGKVRAKFEIPSQPQDSQENIALRDCYSIIKAEYNF